MRGYLALISLAMHAVICMLHTVDYFNQGSGNAQEARTLCVHMVGSNTAFVAVVQSKRTGQVVRAMCILNHPIKDTDESHSAQIILPQKQLNRKHDVYVFCCSYRLHAQRPRESRCAVMPQVAAALLGQTD